ncbi:MAG TPA: hypothetical protein VNO81_13105 [Candidatus Nitrosotenuis sp.]|jgi:hypothetical protein|nr:hypothetical protein [Candidatus Nitrosotenuis sp.]
MPKTWRLTLILICLQALIWLLLGTTVWARPTLRLGDLLLTFGTQLMGAVLAVCLIDGWLEQARRREDMRREAANQAWHLLEDIKQAVWIWQGGSLSLDLSELCALLAQTGEPDHPTQETRTRLVRLAEIARQTIAMADADLWYNYPGLRRAYEMAASIHTDGSLLGHRDVARKLELALRTLADVLGKPVHEPRYVRRDSSPQKQQQRAQTLVSSEA